MLGNLFGVNKDHRANGQMSGWTIASSISPIVSVTENEITVPTETGVQFAYQSVPSTASDSFSMFGTAGVGLVTLPKPDTEWAIENFITVIWPAPSCQPAALGAGLVVSDTVGIGVLCSGTLHISTTVLAFQAH